MAGGLASFAVRWSIAEAWATASDVTAAAYGVGVELLRAESRGRGPRPPREAWEAKKVAVYLAVVLSDCDYAELGRLIGLHKDTVSSHCAAVRNSVLDSDMAETSAQALEALARGRLELNAGERLNAMRAHLTMLQSATVEVLGLANHPTAHPTPHPTLVLTSRERDQKPGTASEAP